LIRLISKSKLFEPSAFGISRGISCSAKAGKGENRNMKERKYQR